MRQVLRAGALGRPRGMGWGGRWERGSGWGTHVNPWPIHVNVWQKPLQYCKVISLQLIKINEKKLHLLKVKVAQQCRLFATPWTIQSLNSPGQNTGLSLLQGIFPTQGSNPGLCHCTRFLYQLSYKVIVLI